MPSLTGLPGVKRKETPCAGFRSPSGALRVLRRGLAASTASDNGAVIVWTDDAGFYRCEFNRHRQPINREKYRTQVQVVAWLKEWMPKMEKDVAE